MCSPNHCFKAKSSEAVPSYDVEGCKALPGWALCMMQFWVTLRSRRCTMPWQISLGIGFVHSVVRDAVADRCCSERHRGKRCSRLCTMPFPQRSPTPQRCRLPCFTHAGCSVPSPRGHFPAVPLLPPPPPPHPHIDPHAHLRDTQSRPDADPFPTPPLPHLPAVSQFLRF